MSSITYFHSLPDAETALPGPDASAASLLRATGYTWSPQLGGYALDAPVHDAARARDKAIAALIVAGRPVSHRIFRAGLGEHDRGRELADSAAAFAQHVAAVAVYLSAQVPGDTAAPEWMCTIEHNPTRRTRATIAGGLWGPPEAYARLQDRRLPRLAVLQSGNGEGHLLLTAPGTDGAVPELAAAMAPQTLDLDAPFAEQVPPPTAVALPKNPAQAAERISAVLRPQLRAAREAFARLAADHVRATPVVAVGIHPALGVVAMTATEDPSPARIDEILTGCGFDLVGAGIYSCPEAEGRDDYLAARTAVADLRSAGIPVRDDLPPPRGTRIPGAAPWAAAPSPRGTAPTTPGPRR